MPALLKKQKPMAVLLSAWWPGGRTTATPARASPRTTAVATSTQAPADRRAHSAVCWLTYVSVQQGWREGGECEPRTQLSTADMRLVCGGSHKQTLQDAKGGRRKAGAQRRDALHRTAPMPPRTWREVQAGASLQARVLAQQVHALQQLGDVARLVQVVGQQDGRCRRVSREAVARRVDCWPRQLVHGSPNNWESYSTKCSASTGLQSRRHVHTSAPGPPRQLPRAPAGGGSAPPARPPALGRGSEQSG